MKKKFHKYHMVEMSPWPIMVSMSVLTIMSSMAMWYQFKSMMPTVTATVITSIMSYLWWQDVIRESASQGYHQESVSMGVKMGMLLFITSEILFFMSFFWAYFHSSISPNHEIGQIWPPHMIKPFNPMNVPLLNTIILLSSGVSVTWAHHSIMMNDSHKTVKSMIITVLLGIYFSILQAMEYMQAEFSIADSIYGSTFFMATGFHGLHVIIGTTFLIITTLRIKNKQLNMSHLIGFEAAAWYWHFVDVVWIFLYISIYWWGA